MLRAFQETKTLKKIIYTSSFFALGPTDGYIADEKQVFIIFSLPIQIHILLVLFRFLSLIQVNIILIICNPINKYICTYYTCYVVHYMILIICNAIMLLKQVCTWMR